MHTWIYKSSRRQNTYLYITARDDFDKVPSSLLELMGGVELVIDIDLHEKRKLAQANASDVIHQLETVGYFLQMPPADHSKTPLC